MQNIGWQIRISLGGLAGVILAGYVLVSLALVGGLVEGASPQEYTWGYNLANLYQDYELHYSFSGLDTAVQYTFQMQRLDDSGNVVSTFGAWSVGPGTASAERYFDHWSVDADYPFRVVDQYGQVLGSHYITLDPLAAWQTSAGNNDADEKVGIGGTIHNPIDVNGWHHSEDHETVLTQSGGVALLHFGVDAVEAATSNVDVTQLGGSGANSYLLSEIQCAIEGTVAVTGAVAEQNFVVLNTTGVRRGFMDSDLAESCYLVGNDPGLGLYPAGVYQYSYYNGVRHLGESLWIVGESKIAGELRYAALTQVKPAGKQVVDVFVRSPGVWAGLDIKSIDDSEFDVAVAGVTGSHVINTRLDYTAGGALPTDVIADVETKITFTSTLLSWSAVPGEYAFVESVIYDVGGGGGLTTRIRDLQLSLGLDNQLGQMITFLLVLVVAFGVLAWRKQAPLVYVLAYTGLTVIFVLGGLLVGWPGIVMMALIVPAVAFGVKLPGTVNGGV